MAYTASRTQPECHCPGTRLARIIPWFFRLGDSLYGSRICPMRRTASDCRQTRASAGLRPGTGARQDSHSASAPSRMARASRPAAKLSQAVRAASALPSVKRTATPQARLCPAGMEPSPSWKTLIRSLPLQLACSLSAWPPCTWFHTPSAQVDRSAPAIGT